MNQQSSKLQAKDLITIGIFTAIYFVVFLACAMLGFIPVFLLAMTFYGPIITGIPFMLYLTKIKKFGMVTITAVICGILMFVFGMGYFTMFTALIFGLAADFILKAGNYTSKKNTTLAYAVYSVWFIGNYIPLYLTRESYFADLVSGYGQEYVDTLRAYTPGWMFLVLLASCFIGGLIGAALGKAVLKKHFVRAGIV